MEDRKQPLVSVPVITYNSAKFVLETLESIKAQTYQNIELIISDDCSTDNTVELCQKWVEENIDRFVRTQIITVDNNTGVSANLNRAESACQGEWVKPIAGDDMLMPNSIEIYTNYVNENPDVVYLFGKIEAFGASEERNEYFAKKVFDYSFFDLDIKEQLERLVFGGNCVPASTCFYNRIKSIELGITNDERIPLLEDWPKWINILNEGIKLHFINEYVVRYRIHDESLSTSGGFPSYNMSYSLNMFNLLYRYPEWIKRDESYANQRMINTLLRDYHMLLKQYNMISSSYAYKIGKCLLRPFSLLRNLCKKSSIQQ